MFDFWMLYSGGRIFEFDGCFYGDLLTYFDYVMLLVLLATVCCVVVAGFTFDSCCWALLFLVVILDSSGFCWGCCYTVDFFIPWSTLNPRVSCINALLATVSSFFCGDLAFSYFFNRSSIFFALYYLNVLTHSAAIILV